MAAAVGYWLGGFIVTMLIPFVLLRIAARRPPGIGLRWAAVGFAALFVAAGLTADALNPGGLVALIVALAWASHTPKATAAR